MKSKVRVIHNVANGPNVNVYVDGIKVLENVAYKAVSDYLSLPAGKHSLAIATPGSDKTITGIYVNLIAHGLISDLKTIKLLALQDNNDCPAPGKAHVRFIHAAAGVPPVNVIAN